MKFVFHLTKMEDQKLNQKKINITLLRRILSSGILIVLIVYIGVTAHIHQSMIRDVNTIRTEIDNAYMDVLEKDSHIQDAIKWHDLYQILFYREIQSYIKSSSDEVFLEVANKAFPSQDEFNNDRENAFVTICAFLSVYEEIYDYGNVKKYYQSITDTYNLIIEATDEYNNTINVYNELIDDYMASKYYKMYSNHTNNYKKFKQLELDTQTYNFE